MRILPLTAVNDETPMMLLSLDHEIRVYATPLP